MMESPSVHLQNCLDRLRQGDKAAREELLHAACDRLQGLTRKMLRDYRGVQRWEETGDVLQNALLRLCRALESLTPPTVGDFYRLAAAQIRRELIDLARHYYGPQGAGAHHASQKPADASQSGIAPLHEAADRSCDPGQLGLWTEFHAQVEALPSEEKEIFDLLFYQGLSQEEAAGILNASVRTVKRRWQAARLKLSEALGGTLPGM
jgi:RNA polymerase sigma-70 factor (ECF subfamily)